VPIVVLNAVAPHELGMASGINYMLQRFGAVFGRRRGPYLRQLVAGQHGRGGRPKHFRFGHDAGLMLGHEVARFALNNALLPAHDSSGQPRGDRKPR